MIYELLGMKDSDDPELMPPAGDLEMAECAKQAATALAAGEQSAARLIHLGAVAQFPDDAVVRALLATLPPGPADALPATQK